MQQVTPSDLSPPGGTYVGPQTVTLSDGTSGATIYYTTDGSVPTPASTVYTGPIAVTRTTTFKAMAAASGMADSAVATATYTIMQQVAPPTFSPPEGTYVGPQTVTLSDATSGATIYYTTDGSVPTPASTVYTGPIAVTRTTTLKAMAAASGMADSAVATAAYTIMQQVAPPTFSPPEGTYVGPQTVTLSDGTSGATIYYTTDGSVPTPASTVYTGPIAVTRTTTLNAMAAASGMADNAVATAAYRSMQQVAPPTFNPPEGTYVGPQTVTLSDGTSGATIYYTTDGSVPTPASTVYTGPIAVTRTTTLKAMATASGMADSAVATATYTVRVAPPTFSPPEGTYVGPQT